MPIQTNTIDNSAFEAAQHEFINGLKKIYDTITTHQKLENDEHTRLQNVIQSMIKAIRHGNARIELRKLWSETLINNNTLIKEYPSYIELIQKRNNLLQLQTEYERVLLKIVLLISTSFIAASIPCLILAVNASIAHLHLISLTGAHLLIAIVLLSLCVSQAYFWFYRAENQISRAQYLSDNIKKCYHHFFAKPLDSIDDQLTSPSNQNQPDSSESTASAITPSHELQNTRDCLK